MLAAHQKELPDSHCNLESLLHPSWAQLQARLHDADLRDWINSEKWNWKTWKILLSKIWWVTVKRKFAQRKLSENRQRARRAIIKVPQWTLKQNPNWRRICLGYAQPWRGSLITNEIRAET